MTPPYMEKRLTQLPVLLMEHNCTPKSITGNSIKYLATVLMKGFHFVPNYRFCLKDVHDKARISEKISMRSQNSMARTTLTQKDA